MSKKLLVLHVFIFSIFFNLDVFASSDYRLYQNDLREFSTTHILKSFVRGIESNKDRILSFLKQVENVKNIDETVLDIDIYDYNSYSSGIRIFKVYRNEGTDNQDVLGFVIVSYNSSSNAFLTPVLIRSNLENVSVNENNVAFSLITVINEILGKKDKIAIPYSWLITDRYFKQLVEQHKLSSSSKFISKKNDMYLLNLESLDLRKLNQNEPYNVSEISVFSPLGTKILNDILFPEELSTKYKFDQLRKFNINYKLIIPILEKIEILKQKIYQEGNNNFTIRKEPSLLNYFKVSDRIKEVTFLDYYDIYVKEGFNIRKIYNLIRDTYFYEEAKDKIEGMKLLGELLSFINQDQVIELQKIALRNEEFLSIVLWHVEDITLKRDVISGLLWVKSEYSQDILLKIFDKYKEVRNLERTDVELILTVLDFVYENNYSIKEIDYIVKRSLWKKSERNKKDVKMICQKIASIMEDIHNNGCDKFFDK